MAPPGSSLPLFLSFPPPGDSQRQRLRETLAWHLLTVQLRRDGRQALGLSPSRFCSQPARHAVHFQAMQKAPLLNKFLIFKGESVYRRLLSKNNTKCSLDTVTMTVVRGHCVKSS